MTEDLTAQQFADKLGVTRQLIYYHAKKIAPAEKVYNDENNLVFTTKQQAYLMSFMTETFTPIKQDSEENSSLIPSHENMGKDEKIEPSLESIVSKNDEYESIKRESLVENKNEEVSKNEFSFDPELAREILLVRQNEEKSEINEQATEFQKLHDKDFIGKDKELSDKSPDKTGVLNHTVKLKNDDKGNREDESVKSSSKSMVSNKDMHAHLVTKSDESSTPERTEQELIKEANETHNQIEKSSLTANDNQSSNETMAMDKEIPNQQNNKTLNNMTNDQGNLTSENMPTHLTQNIIKDYIQSVVRSQLKDLWLSDESERELLVEEINVKNQQIAELHQLLDQQQQLMLITEQKHSKLIDTLNQQLEQLEYSSIIETAGIYTNSEEENQQVENKVEKEETNDKQDIEAENKKTFAPTQHDNKEYEREIELPMDSNNENKDSYSVNSTTVKKSWWQRLFSL